MRPATPTPPLPARTREEGFTLIELLIVTAIIGVLAAIAIPSFLGQNKKAMDVAAKNDVRTLAGMVEECTLTAPSYRDCNTAAELNGVPGLKWSNGGEPGTVRITRSTGERYRAVAVSKAQTNGLYHTFIWVGKEDNQDRRLCTAGGSGETSGGCLGGSW